MRRPLLILLTLLGVFTACGRSEKALQELGRMNVEYTETNFLANARDGNTVAVKLFLEAGMNTGVKRVRGKVR